MVRSFARSAKKSSVSSKLLEEVLEEFIQAPPQEQRRHALGSGLYKLRVPTKSGRGKSAGSRVIIACRLDDITFWLHLFDKNDKENICHAELHKLKALSRLLLGLSPEQLDRLVSEGEIEEIA